MARYNALDIIKENNSGKEKFTLMIQRGTDVIDSKGMFRITQPDCLLQANWSRQRQKFHPKTTEMMKVFWGSKHAPKEINADKQIAHVMGRIDRGDIAPMELFVLGMCELILWQVEVCKKHKAKILFYIYQPEQGLHPCYQVCMTEMLIKLQQFVDDELKSFPLRLVEPKNK